MTAHKILVVEDELMLREAYEDLVIFTLSY